MIVSVEIAFATSPDDPSPVWVDVSDYVEASSNVTISRGRSDELTQVQPSLLTPTLDNKDGRFTPGNVSSPYYPNVKKNRRIRVSVDHNAVTYRRFTGYIDEWPVQWPNGTDEYSSVTISASSRRARLAEGVELRSIVEEEYLYDKPDCYYPISEANPAGGGGGKAADISGNQIAALAGGQGTGSAITWQGATGPGTDELLAPLFNGGKYAAAHTDQTLLKGTDASFTMEAFFSTTDSGTPRTIATLANAWWYTYVGINVLGKLFAASPGYSMNSTAAVNDGAVHHVAVRETTSGGTTTLTLFLDGAIVDTDTMTATPTDRSDLLVGAMTNDSISDRWNGSVSHVAIFSGATEVTDARIAAHAASGLTGFEGESSDARIQRLARLAGIPSAQVTTEAGVTTSMAYQTTGGRTALDLMTEVETTENGLLFDGKDGNLVFQARSHRYSAVSAFTLDASLHQIEASLEAKLDGQQIANDVTVKRARVDAGTRVVNTQSITDYGIHRDELELFTTSDNEVTDAANWRVQRYAEPDVRVHSVAADVYNSSTSLITSLLSSDLGARITLRNLPSQAPATSMDGFIEGTTETIGSASYEMAFELSPVGQSDVWVLEDAKYGQYDAYPISY